MACERLVYRHSDDDGSEPVRFHVTVTFEEQGSATLLTMRMRFESAAERNRVAEEYGAIEGAIQCMDRLQAHLATMSGTA